MCVRYVGRGLGGAWKRESWEDEVKELRLGQRSVFLDSSDFHTDYFQIPKKRAVRF